MPTNSADVNLYDVACYSMAGQTGAQMIALVKEAIEKKDLLVFLFHGVGGGHSLNVSQEAHSDLLHFLKQNEKQLWIAPMVEVADYVTTHKKVNKGIDDLNAAVPVNCIVLGSMGIIFSLF